MGNVDEAEDSWNRNPLLMSVQLTSKPLRTKSNLLMEMLVGNILEYFGTFKTRPGLAIGELGQKSSHSPDSTNDHTVMVIL